MAQIPFNVSARTARLIGRENVSNVEGAIVELVKNTYDADARFCYILIDNYFLKPPQKIHVNKWAELDTDNADLNLFHSAYTQTDIEYYTLNRKLDGSLLQRLTEQCEALCSIHIVDNGEGMTEKVITDHWMTIGTSIKAHEYMSKKGRIKVGAKGIGRFALDRLGYRCDLVTRPVDSDTAYEWSVDWRDFETPGKRISDVTAEFNHLRNFDFQQHCKKIFKHFGVAMPTAIKPNSGGTVISISGLRDSWHEAEVLRVYDNLATLIPPREERHFSIHLHNSLNPATGGVVESSVCDDFDYKLTVRIDNSIAHIELSPREFNVQRFDQTIFDRPEMQLPPYDRNTLLSGTYKTDIPLSSLLVGMEETSIQSINDQIGPFEFILFYMKQASTGDNDKKYKFRDFEPSRRKKWLNQFSGIRIFRDEFRVRPYGERDSPSFDWLGLGPRKLNSPAAVSRRGAWRADPGSLSGVVHISRVSNLSLEDKSNREGLQENETFRSFKAVIIALIKYFEDHRSYIASVIDKHLDESSNKHLKKKRATSTALRIVRHANKVPHTPAEKQLAVAFVAQEEEIEELKNEQKLLRALASSGVVLASFTHELKNLSGRLGTRFDDLEYVFNMVADRSRFGLLPRGFEPDMLLTDLREQDWRAKHWLDYALGVVQKDKRRRKLIDLVEFLNRFNDSWRSTLDERHASIEVDFVSGRKAWLRAFEIDLDSVFSNLLINSLEAFQRREAPKERLIKISVEPKGPLIEVLYEDSGPGLHMSIRDPDKIFDAFYTTKRDVNSGEEIGTGIGMWLVSGIIDDYDGQIEVVRARPGFSVRMTFRAAEGPTDESAS